MLILGQKSYFLGPTIFEIPQPKLILQCLIWTGTKHFGTYGRTRHYYCPNIYTVNKGQSVFSISRQELIAISLLSLYSVIEGLVVGLGLTNNNVWQLFAVILVHQIITSISLGKDNSRNGFQTKISQT